MGRQFTFLRGLAILLVLVNHSITMSLWMAQRLGLPQPDLFLYRVMVVLKMAGLITVPVFLFLSGAFFAFGLQNRPLIGAYRMVWQNVLGALWPYLIWTILFNLMDSYLLGEHYSLIQFIRNILTGYPFNFVPVLIFFYILAPFLILGFRRFPAVTLLLFLFYQFFLIVEENPGIMGLPHPDWMHIFALPVLRSPLSFWAMFFPLGVLYQRNVRVMSDFVRKYAAAIIACLVIFIVLGSLNELGVIAFPLGKYLVPAFFILLIPIVQRNATPLYLWIEAIGKRSYGFYLTNLIALTLTLLGLQIIFPWLLEQYIVLVPFLFVMALYIPWGLMKLLEMSSKRVVYRYVFG